MESNVDSLHGSNLLYLNSDFSEMFFVPLEAAPRIVELSPSFNLVLYWLSLPTERNDEARVIVELVVESGDAGITLGNSLSESSSSSELATYEIEVLYSI